jgi:pimeloyl-ACP methyl ester carboxylesterase
LGAIVLGAWLDIFAYDHRGHGNSTPLFRFFEKDDALAALQWFEGVVVGRVPNRVGGVSYGGTALQLAPMIPDSLHLADSSYSSMKDIVGVRAAAVGAFGKLLLPGCGRLCGPISTPRLSLENASSQAGCLSCSSTAPDEFTPAAHSEAIYANSDHSRTVPHVNGGGSATPPISPSFEAYRQLFNDFIFNTCRTLACR